MKENLLFIATTEYQILVTLNYILKNFHDRNKYNITFIMLSEVNVGRIDKQDFDFEKTELDINFIRIEFSYWLFPMPNLKRQLRQVLSKKYSTLFFGFELDFVTVFLINSLKKKGTKIILYPDGIKAYTKWKGNAGWKSRLLMYKRYLKFLYSNNLKGYSVEKFSYQYADMHQIDSVITQFPKVYDNYNNKEIIPFDFLDNILIIQKLRRVFNYPDRFKELVDKDVIVYLATHSEYFKEEEVVDFEIETVQKLREVFPEKKIYFKPHPILIHNKLLETVRTIENLEIINENMPGELFITAFENTLFVSMYSTTFLVFPHTNQFIWTWRTAENKGLIPNSFDLQNPTSYINEIHQLEDLNSIQIHG